MRRLRLLLAASALVSSVLMVGAPGPATAAVLQPVWRVDLPGAVVRESSPAVAQLRPGSASIVFGAHDGKLYALHGDSGATTAGFPVQLSEPINSSPSAADVTGDGFAELFVGAGRADDTSGALYSISNEGGVRWRQVASDPGDPNLAIHSTPALGDINKDGVADATAGALGLQMYSYSVAGALNPGWPFYTDDTVFSSPALADVNGDGQTDVVIGADSSPGPPIDHRGGMLRAISGAGQLLWEVRTNEIIRSSPSIGDVTGDGASEIVVGAGDYWVRQPGGASDATKVFMVDFNGVKRWERDLGGYTVASPALADVDGDGVRDIVIGTTEGPSGQRIHVLDGNGNPKPGWPQPSRAGVIQGAISTADLNGDGAQDLLVPTGGAVIAYNGRTGAELWSIAEGLVSFQNTPLVTDIDGNGRLDIFVVGGRGDGSGVAMRVELAPGDNGRLGSNGWHMFRGDARRTGNVNAPPLAQSSCPEPPQGGYWMPSSGGSLLAFCQAPNHGSLDAVTLARPVVGMAAHPSGNGYWMVASDGGIFSFGNARFFGSTGAIRLNQPIVGMASTPSGNGYWFVASDGGIFSFGDAVFRGSTGAIRLNQPIVGMASTPSGNGYWLVARDGGVFSFGDAVFRGSTGAIRLNQPIVGMASTPSGNGYWFVASDGGVFSFGDARFHGSTGAIRLAQPIVGMASTRTGQGYWLVAADGGVFGFDAPFLGSGATRGKKGSIVGIARWPIA